MQVRFLGTLHESTNEAIESATLTGRESSLSGVEWCRSVLSGAIEDTPQQFALIKTRLVSNSGVPYRDYRRTLTPDPRVVWREITVGYAALAITLGSMFALETFYPVAAYIAVIPTAFLLGALLHYLGLFQHAAAHDGLAKDRRANDRLANIFLGALLASEIQAYRVQHMLHHRNHGTLKDNENAYVDALDSRYFITWLSGMRTIQKLLAPAPMEAEAPPAGGGRFRLLSLAGHGLVFIVLILSGYVAVALAWALAVGILFPMISDTRLILEHRREDADPRVNYRTEAHGAYTRMFRGGLSRRLLGAAGFDRHMLHHWEPAIPYERLQDLETYLHSAGLTELIEARKTTYPRAFFSLALRPLLESRHKPV
jgi:fatty acid desaturase